MTPLNSFDLPYLEIASIDAIQKGTIDLEVHDRDRPWCLPTQEQRDCSAAGRMGVNPQCLLMRFFNSKAKIMQKGSDKQKKLATAGEGLEFLGLCRRVGDAVREYKWPFEGTMKVPGERIEVLHFADAEMGEHFQVAPLSWRVANTGAL